MIAENEVRPVREAQRVILQYVNHLDARTLTRRFESLIEDRPGFEDFEQPQSLQITQKSKRVIFDEYALLTGHKPHLGLAAGQTGLPWIGEEGEEEVVGEEGMVGMVVKRVRRAW